MKTKKESVLNCPRKNFNYFFGFPLTLSDEGLTGTSMKKRSEFNRMIAACQQGGTFFTMGGASGHNIQDGILEPDDPLFKKKCQRLDASGAMYRVNHSP